ncbi:MAG: glutamine synthetase family protein [Gammaproteobacteria bacterium]|nr:glutamine synthetase family protein [Gammaproteobacteria bacterium]MDH3536719.1 glutamine synthetase family protein [Gammaproteobacteria bacterium]
MKDWIEQHQITEVECIVPDLAGAARGKIMPAAKFTGATTLRMPQAIFMQSVTGEYLDSFDEINPLDIDMILQPDPYTIRRLPWAREPSAQVIHDCFDLKGEPISFSPRQVLRNVIEAYHAEGWKPVVAPELEFYLLQPNLDPKNPLLPPVGRTGRAERSGQSFNIDAVNDFDPMFDDMYEFCEGQGLEIDTLIHEEGMGQMEINLLHGDPLELADQAFLFKRTVREAALRHDLYATFMAKPMQAQPGSAMHIHQSVEDLKTGENICSTPDGRPNDLLLSHIAGLQRFLPEAMALMSPYVNSYRRIVREMSAPINFHWDFDNRTTGFRVPDNNPKSMRVENRIPSADVNPYLAIATSLACGYIGMKQGLKPTPALNGSAYDQPFQLSRHWYDSLQHLSDSRELRAVLGDAFIDVYVGVKEVEFDNFLNVISPWEREHLLLKV